MNNTDKYTVIEVVMEIINVTGDGEPLRGGDE